MYKIVINEVINTGFMVKNYVYNEMDLKKMLIKIFQKFYNSFCICYFQVLEFRNVFQHFEGYRNYN